MDFTEDSKFSHRCSEHQGKKNSAKVWLFVSALQDYQVVLGLFLPGGAAPSCSNLHRVQGRWVSDPPDHQEVLGASSPITAIENPCLRSWVVPRPNQRGAERKEGCTFAKKAVIEDLEFLVAFEPPLKGIVAAPGLSRGSKKKRFGQKNISSGYSLDPKIPLQIIPKLFATHTHKAAHSKVKVLCTVLFHPNSKDLQPLLSSLLPKV